MDVTITFTLRLDDVEDGTEIQDALGNLAAVMEVQAEDGLYELGSPDAELDDHTNEHLSSITVLDRRVATTPTPTSATRELHAAREAVIRAVHEGVRSDALAKRVNDLAETEAATYVRMRHAEVLESAGKDAADKAVLALLFNGPDDTWSGRTNDVRRAHFDGLRTTVQALARTY